MEHRAESKKRDGRDGRSGETRKEERGQRSEVGGQRKASYRRVFYV